MEVLASATIEIQANTMRCVVCNRKLGKSVCPCDPKPRKRREKTEDELFCEKLEAAEIMNGRDDDEQDQDDS